MGRYGIGARVRDLGGDEGEIVGKRKGERLVKYDDSVFGTQWYSKAGLTPVDDFEGIIAIRGDKASTLRGDVVCAEKGEVAFAVGDRVVFTTEETGHGAVYHDGVLTIDAVVDDGVSIVYPPFGQYADRPLTQVTTPDCLRHFTLEAGKFYRTRDGRKVGPMERWDEDVEHPWQQVGESHFYSVGGDLWRDNGTSAYGMADIVAEWVEPVATAGQAEPWTDFDHWDAPPAKIVVEDATDPVTPWTIFDAKPGDVVRCDLWTGQMYTTGATYRVGDDGMIADTSGVKRKVMAGEWSLVTEVEPRPKFKVGDRVVCRKYMNGEDCFGTAIEVRDGVVFANDWSVGSADGALSEDRLELVTAPPLLIGQAVTAYGYISGANGSNFSVVFGDRSYDLPATLLKKAA